MTIFIHIHALWDGLRLKMFFCIYHKNAVLIWFYAFLYAVVLQICFCSIDRKCCIWIMDYFRCRFWGHNLFDCVFVHNSLWIVRQRWCRQCIANRYWLLLDSIVTIENTINKSYDKNRQSFFRNFFLTFFISWPSSANLYNLWRVSFSFSSKQVDTVFSIPHIEQTNVEFCSDILFLI